MLQRIALLAAVLTSSTFAQSGRLGVIELGAVFPEIRLPSLADQQPQLLSGYRGKRVVLHVFASW